MDNRVDAASTLVRDVLIGVAPERVDALDALDADVDLWEALDLDSLDHLTVMNKLADALGRDIPERDYPRLLSVRQLRDYVGSCEGEPR